MKKVVYHRLIALDEKQQAKEHNKRKLAQTNNVL
jgi:hypothetical protein